MIASFMKQFQTELLYTLFSRQNSTDVVNKGYQDALLLVTKATVKIMTGEDLQNKDLVIPKILMSLLLFN